MSSRLRTCLTRSLFLSFFYALAAYGQGFSAGKITGLAVDNSGAVIPDAKIEAANVDTGEVRRTVSNGSGVYALSQVSLRFEF